MKIKVPRKIKIGTFDCTLNYRENMKVDEDWRGSFNQRTGEIFIDRTCGVGKDRVFLHELLHVVDKNYECGLDEITISRMANGFAEFLFNNLGIELDWSEIK